MRQWARDAMGCNQWHYDFVGLSCLCGNRDCVSVGDESSSSLKSHMDYGST